MKQKPSANPKTAPSGSNRKPRFRPENLSSRENTCIRNSYAALLQSLETAKSESPDAAKAWVKRIAAISM